MISLALMSLSLSFQAAPAQHAPAGYICTAASAKGTACVTAPLGQPGAVQRDTRSQRVERTTCNPDSSKDRACHHDKLSLAAKRHAQAPVLADNN